MTNSLFDKLCPECGRLVAMPCSSAAQKDACEFPESTADLRAARPSRHTRQPVAIHIRIPARKETA